LLDVDEVVNFFRNHQDVVATPFLTPYAQLVIGQRERHETLHFRCTPQYRRQAIGRRYVDSGSGAAAIFFFAFFLGKDTIGAANSREAEGVGAFGATTTGWTITAAYSVFSCAAILDLSRSANSLSVKLLSDFSSVVGGRLAAESISMGRDRRRFWASSFARMSSNIVAESSVMDSLVAGQPLLGVIVARHGDSRKDRQI
jgi:hypothetical protein